MGETDNLGNHNWPPFAAKTATRNRTRSKKLDGRFRGEVVSDLKKRPLGYRIKHRVGGNWLKMYDKFGQVLRIEVVINQPQALRMRRWGTRRGQRVLAWFPLAKSVALLDRYAEISLQAARRYLDALARLFAWRTRRWR